MTRNATLISKPPAYTCPYTLYLCDQEVDTITWLIGQYYCRDNVFELLIQIHKRFSHLEIITVETSENQPNILSLSIRRDGRNAWGTSNGRVLTYTWTIQ